MNLNVYFPKPLTELKEAGAKLPVRDSSSLSILIVIVVAVLSVGIDVHRGQRHAKGRAAEEGERAGSGDRRP